MIRGRLLRKDAVLLDNVLRADSFFERSRGLLGRSMATAKGGMIIAPCSSVHTFFMGYSLDIVYLDQAFVITSVRSNVKPWRLSWGRGATLVLELAAGMASQMNLNAGDQLVWQDI